MGGSTVLAYTIIVVLTLIVLACSYFQLTCYSYLSSQQYSPGDNALIENLHILSTSIEDLYEAGKFNGPEERFFAIVEKSASKRPVSIISFPTSH